MGILLVLCVWSSEILFKLSHVAQQTEQRRKETLPFRATETLDRCQPVGCLLPRTSCNETKRERETVRVTHVHTRCHSANYVYVYPLCLWLTYERKRQAHCHSLIMRPKRANIMWWNSHKYDCSLIASPAECECKLMDHPRARWQGAVSLSGCCYRPFAAAFYCRYRRCQQSILLARFIFFLLSH